MSDDRRVTPRLERLNWQDVRDLVGTALEERGQRMAQRRLVQTPRVLDDTLSGWVPPQRNASSMQVRVRLPDGHPAHALTLDVQCACGQPVPCEHAATLLVSWVLARSTFLPAPRSADSPMPTLRLPDDALWRGMRGGYHSLAGLLNQQRMGDVRKLAKRLAISGTSREKEVLVQEVSASLSDADTLSTQVAALTPFQRVLLYLLVLCDTPLSTAYLDRMIERLGIHAAASSDETLKALSSAGLAFPTTNSGSQTTVWSVPLDLAPSIEAERQVLRLDEHARADPASVSTVQPGQPDQPQPMTAAAALHGLWIALQTRRVQALPHSKPVGNERSIQGLKGWNTDPDDLARLQQPGNAWRWQNNPDTTLALLPPDPLVSDSDLSALADDIGSTPDMVHFLLRVLHTLGLVAVHNRRVRLLDVTERLLARLPADLTRLLATTWAWDTSWSEVDDLEGLVLRRRYVATAAWRPDQLYAELAATRRSLMRLLRALEPGCWYTVPGFVALVFKLQPRLLYEQRAIALKDTLREAWWLCRPDGQRLDPHIPADWRYAEERIITHLLCGALRWLGLVELAMTTDGTHLFRITPLGAYLLGQRADYQAAPSTPALHITADEAQQHMTIQVALTAADAATLAQLARFADVQKLVQGMLTYVTTPQRMRDALQQGQTTDAITAFLQANAREPLPAAAQALLTHWGQAFGRAVVYDHVALLELSDDLLLPELLRATRLENALLEPLSPRLVAVDPQHADQLFNELVAKGYTPRRIQ